MKRKQLVSNASKLVVIGAERRMVASNSIQPRWQKQ